MKQSEKITKYDYEIELIRSDRRTIALQVYPDGRIVCRAPRRATKWEVIRFLDEHEDWIAGAWEKLQKRIEAKKSRKEKGEKSAARKEIGEKNKKILKKHQRFVLPDCLYM